MVKAVLEKKKEKGKQRSGKVPPPGWGHLARLGGWLLPLLRRGPGRCLESKQHIWKWAPLKQTLLHNNRHLEPVTTTFLVKIVFDMISPKNVAEGLGAKVLQERL